MTLSWLALGHAVHATAEHLASLGDHGPPPQRDRGIHPGLVIELGDPLPRIEMAALACWGIVGWQLTDGVARWVLVVVLPGAAVAIWGTFRTPDDHSVKGYAPIAVPGPIRLALELCVLLGAAISTTLVWRPAVGIALAAAVLLHLATTPRRIRRLLDQRLD